MAARVVVLGGGFAGAYAAQELLRRARTGEIELTLVDRQNYFVFHPLLVEAGTGSLHPRHAVVGIRAFTGRGGRFLMAEVEGVDLDARTALLRVPLTGERLTLAYDQLVVALGSVTRRPSVPGLAEHAFELKRLADAVALRDRMVRLLEAAEACTEPEERRRLLHLVVVGASYTGAEVAGEFEVFLREATRSFPSIEPGECRVSLVELGERILPTLDPSLSRFAEEKLQKRGVALHLRESIEVLTPHGPRLASGATLDAATTIWCAGIAPSPLLGRLGLPRDERGFLETTPELAVPGAEGVWGVGDCAVNPDPSGQAYPATAQHAVREGRHVARNILARLRGEPETPLRFTALGSLAALGCRSGVARVFGVRIAGLPAWFLWRSVYLMKMPGLARKVRVALDWTLDLLFRREIVQLGLSDPRVPETGARRDASD